MKSHTYWYFLLANVFIFSTKQWGFCFLVVISNNFVKVFEKFAKNLYEKVGDKTMPTLDTIQ